jgi:hypothetical protein
MGWDDSDLTVGKLFRLWRWFDQHTASGNAHGVTSSLLDRIIGVAGFCEAVQSVGWIEISADGIRLPNFERHNGNTAKTRALTAKRVAKSKGKGNGQGNAASVTLSLPREEKRREDATDPDGSGGEPPAKAGELSDRDRIFAYGVPMLVNAGNTDKAARSFLAGKCKDHGDAVVVKALRDCYREQPVDPLSWLGKRLPMRGNKASAHSGFDKIDYRKGINDDGSFE